MSGTGAKKRSTRVPTSGSVGNSSSHKIKKPSGGAKLSNNGFNNMDTDEETSEGEGVSNSKMNTPQAKCFNNSAIIGSPLGSINYNMEEKEKVFLLLHKSFSLDKTWIDPKIIKTQVEVAVKKSFTLDINLLAVEGKSATAKTQIIRKLFSEINGFGGATTPSKFERIIRSTFTSEASMEKATSLAKDNNIIVNSDFKRQGMHSDWAVVIKKIPMDTLKEMIVTAVSMFGEIKSIKIQLIGIWQKAVVKFAESSQTDQLAAKWSFFIGKNSVCMAKAVGNCETWASRDWYKVLLFTLPVETMVHDLGDFLARADICNRVHCAVVCFENNELLESTFCMEPIFSEVKLSWTRLDLVQCKQCGKHGHSVLKCDAEISTSPKLSKSFKRVVSDENCLQLAKLYAKKSVSISRPAVFGGKSWAQVVSLVSLSNSLYSGSGSGFGSSSDASGMVGHLSSVVPVYSFLKTCLASLEHFLELLSDKVSGIVNKLDNLNLVPLALASSSQSLVVPVTANIGFGLDMVLNNSKPVVISPFLVSSGVSNLGLSTSKVLTLKVGCLELKLMALEALVCLVLEKLDQLCAGSGSVGINVPAKQDDIVRWHMNSESDISIITEMKLKSGIKPWIMNKFLGVCIFMSGFDTDSSGAGVAVIINSFVVQHVLKIDEISGQLISIQLLFKNKLSITILGIYAGASAGVRFGQALVVNSLIISAINSSSFVILGGDFNESNTKKNTSLRKCTDLGLVNSFKGHFLANIGAVLEFFNINHKMISVSVGLEGLLDAQINSIRKQTNRNRWKFDFKDDNVSAALSLVISGFLSAKVLNVLCGVMVRAADAIFSRHWFSEFDCLKNRHLSRFLELELLVAKVRKSYRKSKYYKSRVVRDTAIQSAINKHMENFSSNKGGMIWSILEQSFCKVVLDHLVIGDELVLDPTKVKSRVNSIMAHQYAPLDYVRDDAFSDVMNDICFSKLVNVILNLPDGKKHCGNNMLECLLSLLNSCLNITWVSMISKPYEWDGILTNTRPIVLIEMARKILSKLLSDHISSVCDNFSVLKSTSTQSPVFAVGSIMEDALEKNREVWLLEASLKWIKMCDRFVSFFENLHVGRINRVMTDFGFLNGYNVLDSLDQKEVFSPLLWQIFYDPLLCEVKNHEHLYGYRINTNFVAKSGRIESSGSQFSFFAADAFVNDITINSKKTVVISINKRISNAFLHINRLSISIAKQGKTHRYLDIFLLTDGLSKPSLAKAQLDVRFFSNMILRKALIDKQFVYLVFSVLQPIVSYCTQFSFDVMLRKGLKSKANLFRDFPSKALHHLSFYGVKTFEQIQAKEKVALLVWFSNVPGILGHLFEYHFLDLQILSYRLISGGLFTVSSGSKFFDSKRYLVVWECLHEFWSNVFTVYTDGSLSHLGTAEVVGGTAAYFSDADVGIGIEVNRLLSSTMAELYAVILVLECVPFSCSVIINTDSQATINACASELGLIAPDFRNKCWVERHYIHKLIKDKDFSVGWVKVKGHSSNVHNDKANALAWHTAHSNLSLPISVWKRYIMTHGQVVLDNAQYFVQNIYRFICRAQWEAGLGSVVIDEELIGSIWLQFGTRTPTCCQALQAKL
ncbi:hypothetical protein G9A89_001889 [Geosiphon pyriformis]|nr:hypothetical protein G9A89_001889 [Geosiphon pyriformis]